MMAKASSSSSRTRVYWSILYPDSCHPQWRDILSSVHCIPFVCSPLHDKDVNEVDDSQKKPHWHIIIFFDGPKTIEQAQAIFDSIGAIKCKPVESTKGACRYLIHMDNPEKYQYPQEAVYVFGGIDYQNIINSASDKYKAIREMIDFCKENGIFAYCDLLEYASIYRNDWFTALCDNATLVVKEYLKSRFWYQNQSNPQTKDNR